MRRKKVIALLLASCLLGVSSVPVMAENTSIIDNFNNPAVSAKPMARYWIPDAGATYEDLEREMTELYNAGYGGVEIAYFPGEAAFDNSVYGWDTDAWRTVLKNMLKIAATFEDGFIVDFTITSGWPVAFNDIDPNDEAADRELVSAMAKVTEASVVDIPMSQILTVDSCNNPFIRTNTLVGAVIGQVTDIDANGVPTIDPSTIQKLETTTTGATTIAGIPSVDGLSEDSAEYQYILSLYDGEAPDTSIYFTDSAGNPYDGREAHADTQEYWQTDLSTVDLGDYAPSEGDEIAVGDYVIFGFYERGTAHTTMDMGKYAQYESPQPGPCYETSPYSVCSVEEIKQALDKALFCDEELVTLMKEAAATVGGAIFEDSIENVYAGIAWNSEIEETYQNASSYDVISQLMYITGAAHSTEGNEAQYQADYNAVLADMYVSNHVAGVKEYVNETTDYAYRVQAYHTRATITKSKYDMPAAAATADLAEGESLAFGGNYDNYRLISTGIHLAGNNQLSSESFAIQDGSSYNLTWDRVTKITNGMFAAGVNKVIFHGTSLDVSNASAGGDYEFSSNWPGWSAFISICTDDWDGRMPYFEDVNILTDYMARNQAVLLSGTPKIDLLVYDLNAYDYSTRKENGDNSAFNALLDAGYTYEDIMTDSLLMEELTAQDQLLCAGNTNYKALIVNNLSQATTAAMEKLLSIAESGVPVIFYQTAPSQAASAEETDEAIAALTEQIIGTGNSTVVQSQIEIQNELVKRDITPNASYLKSNLRSVAREDEDGTMYYYLYNNSDEAIDVEVNLSGSGSLYLLNAWNGDISTASSVANGDYVLTKLHLDAYETTIAAVSENADAFSSAITKAPAKKGKAIALDNWNLTIESWGPETDTDVPNDTRKVNLEIGETALGSWATLSAPEEQMAETGVETMADVSGIGYYTIEVDLSEVENVKGGQLALTHGDDMITAITVNGQEVTDLNPLQEAYELGDALVTGINTIEVKLSTTLRNRARVESGYFASTYQTTYGITSATLTPYTE